MPASDQAAPWQALHFLLSAVLLMYVWRFQDIFPGVAKLQLMTVLPPIALLLVLASPGTVSNRGFVRQPAFRCALLILILMVLSVPGSLFPGRSFRFITQDHVKTFLVMLMLTMSIRHRIDVVRYVRVLLVGAAVYCGHTLLFNPIGPNERLGNIIYYDANDLGLLIVCCVPLAVYWSQRPGILRNKLPSAALLGLLVLTMVRTGSRGAFIGFVVTSAYMLFLFRGIPTRHKITVTLVTTLFFGVFAGDHYWESMRTILDPKSDYNWSGESESGRMEVWRRGMGYMADRPFLGVGARCFPIAEGHISPLAERQRFGIGLKWSAAHNSYVQIGAELGVGGLLLFLAMLGFAVAGLIRVSRQPGIPNSGEHRRLAEALSASLVGYAAAGFFLSQAYGTFLYLLLGIVMGFVQLSPRVHGEVAGRTPRARSAHLVESAGCRGRGGPRASSGGARCRHHSEYGSDSRG